MTTRLLLSRLTLILLSFGLTPAGPLPLRPAIAETSRAATASGDIEGFGPVSVSAQSGWLLLGQGLYWTDDGARTWRDVTPQADAEVIQAVHFADASHGWAVLARGGAEGAATFSLARTQAGGRQWQLSPLALFAPDDPDAFASDVYLQFIDSQTGWLVFKRAASRAFNLGALFRTSDGGDSWTRLSIPIGEPVHFSDANNGWAASEGERFRTRDGGVTWEAMPNVVPDAPLANGVSGVTMASSQTGWAMRRSGGCQADAFGQRICTQTTELVRTQDGGATWSALTLPDGSARLTTQQVIASEPPLASAPSAVINTATRTQVYTGQGFDSCTKPTLQQMLDWITNSPYRIWNLYLGGSSVYGPCNTLTADYVAALALQGWRFIPTWVGPQASCSPFGSRIDPANAYQQGIDEANKAIDRAFQLGLTFADKTGTIIYYDLEAYFPQQGDTACRNASKAFIDGWTYQLRLRGNQAGVYGTTCTSYISDFANITNVPDAVWLAVWFLQPGYRQNVDLFGLSCLSDSLWTPNQRLRQYSGGHDETWGNTTVNIDSNVLGGIVVDIRDAQPTEALELFQGEDFTIAPSCLWSGFVEGEFNASECGTGWDDNISSIKLKFGWSARVFRDAGRTGPNVCYPLSDPDLSNEFFAVGTPVDNNISSIRVYANPGCYDIRTYLPIIAR